MCCSTHAEVYQLQVEFVCIYVFPRKPSFYAMFVWPLVQWGPGLGGSLVGYASAQTVDTFSGRTGSNAINCYHLLLHIF